MKTIAITFILVVAFISSMMAQQRSTYNLYRENWMLINPAAFSEDYLIQAKKHIVSATGRYQWTGLEEPLKTIGVQYQQVLEDHHLAIGTSLLNDQTGAIGNTEFFLNTSYQLIFDASKKQFLSLGLGAGVVQYRIDYSDILFQQESSVLTGTQTLYYPDFSLGIFYYLDNTFFAGLSVPQVFNLSTTGENALTSERVPHFMGMAGGYIPVHTSHRFSYLEPSIMVKAVAGLPVNLDINLRYNFQNVFWLGVGYNTAAGIHIETGYFLGRQNDQLLRLGAGYTVRTDAISQVLGNTFEVNTTYSWGKSDIIQCPVW